MQKKSELEIFQTDQYEYKYIINVNTVQTELGWGMETLYLVKYAKFRWETECVLKIESSQNKIYF